MSSSKIPSPARSQSTCLTPRRHRTRSSRSVGSPARSSTSTRLNPIVDQFKENHGNSFALSPLGKTVLNDDTNIEEPRRKSWWKKLENSRDVIELLENNKVMDNLDIIDELDVEVLSQEKKNYTIDIPESSGSESISSIVIPQRKLFTQKDNLPQNKFRNIIDTRETLNKNDKTKILDITTKVGPKILFNKGPTRPKPTFPAALLNISPDKTLANKTNEIPTKVKGQSRNLFGNRAGLKRKNMFADFIVSESEDEITEIQPKLFAFQKNTNPVRHSNIRSARSSPSSSITTDIEMDEWKMLPSSTMVDHQIEAMIGGTTPGKRTRLSKLSEHKESDAGTASITINKTKQSNNSVSSKNTVNSSKNKSKLLSNVTNENQNVDQLNVSKSSKNRLKSKKNESIILDKTKDSRDETKLNKDTGVNGANTNVISNNHESNGIEKKIATNQNEILTDEVNCPDRIGDDEDFKLTYEESEPEETVEHNHKMTTKDTGQTYTISKVTENFELISNSDNQDEEVIMTSRNVKQTKIILGHQENNLIETVKHLKNTDNINADLSFDKGKSSVESTAEQEQIDVPFAAQEDVLIKKIQNSVITAASTENEIVTEIQGTYTAKLSLRTTENHVALELEPNEQNETGNEQTTESNGVAENEIIHENNEVEKEINPTSNEQKKNFEVKDDDHVVEDLKESDEDNQDYNKEQDEEAEVDDDDNALEDEKVAYQDDQATNKEQEEEAEVEYDNNALEDDQATNKKQEEEEAKVEDDDNALENDQATKNEQEEKEKAKVEDDDNALEDEKVACQDDQATSKEQEKEAEVEYDNNALEDDQASNKRQEEEEEIEAEYDDNALEDEHATTEEQEEEAEVEDDDNALEDEHATTEEQEEEEETEVKDDDNTLEDEHATNNEQEEEEETEVEYDDNALEDDQATNKEQEEEEAEFEDDNALEDEKESEEDDEEQEQAYEDIQEESLHESYNEEQQEDEAEHEENEDEQQTHVEYRTENTPNVSHNTSKRNPSNKTPEAILCNTSNKFDSFVAKGRNTSIKATRSILKNFSIRPSIAPPRDSTGFSDGTKNSSAEGSGWDSHRTTRKTLRQTFGKDFTPRKSLRAMVMEKSAKRQTMINEANAKLHQANSTEIPDDMHNEEEGLVENPVCIVSPRTRQTTLDMYTQKIKRENMERKRKIEAHIGESLKSNFVRSDVMKKIAFKPIIRKTKTLSRETSIKPRRIKASAIPLEDLPPELIDDMKYKPPKRFKPSNASWITKRLYKFLEGKLEPKYDYKARVRAEKLVETIYEFTRNARKHRVAPSQAVTELKREMARLEVIKTHFDFYCFFQEYMPMEVIVKVVPDIVNEIQLPRTGIFSDIL